MTLLPRQIKMQMSVHKSREPTAAELHIVNNRATIIHEHVQ